MNMGERALNAKSAEVPKSCRGGSTVAFIPEINYSFLKKNKKKTVVEKLEIIKQYIMSMYVYNIFSLRTINLVSVLQT